MCSIFFFIVNKHFILNALAILTMLSRYKFLCSDSYFPQVLMTYLSEFFAEYFGVYKQ